MELEQYNLTPQEQVAVALYLKSMNKTQSSRDAGFENPSVFYKANVKQAIDEQLKVRASRLRVGADFVLTELVRVYHTAMRDNVKSTDGGIVEPPDLKAATKALDLIGKHVDVKAYDPKVNSSEFQDEVVARLNAGRARVGRAELPLIEVESEPVSFL